MPYNLTSEEDFTQEKDYGENEQYESNLDGQIYNRDDNEVSPGYKRVGMLKQNVDPQDTMLMSHPRKDKVKLKHALDVANKRGHDMLAYHPLEGTAFTGKLDPCWIKCSDECSDKCPGESSDDSICDVDNPRTPKNSVMNPDKVEKYDKDKSNAYILYINGVNPTYKEIITERLNDCVNKISKQTEGMKHRMGYAEYKHKNNGNHMGFNKFVQQSKDMYRRQKIEKLTNDNAERLGEFNTALANNQYSLNILNQMNVSKDELLHKNSYDINGIDEKILTASEKINNLKDKYDFNNKIIKLLRTITLWIFIITMFVLCYFGVRDKYIDTIKPTSKASK
jgi:hypothetical protein